MNVYLILPLSANVQSVSLVLQEKYAMYFLYLNQNKSEYNYKNSVRDS